ncbi:SET domain-containing protein [Diplogelasinospora grovesii]|uniref:SET domain-containing protein n=1 Tax=Diplogelasinospora grovesii TaxID=303347 RepID=A0AAN6NG78_9PEZI|nr:SET domain-containing protein [Diplogelasinospora grovesii]
MKPPQLLPLYATLALAHSTRGSHHEATAHSRHGDHDAQVCRSRTPSVLPGFSSDSTCILDPSDLIATGGDLFDCEAENSQHAWTHSSPCFKSGGKSGATFCVFTDTSFAEGRGASFVTTAKRAAHLASNPAFTQPEVIKGVNQDLIRTMPVKYEVKEFPGKGMGLMATDHIRRGDLIMANTVSLMIDYRTFDELLADEYQQLQAFAVDYLPKPHRSAILNLSTHDAADSLSHIALVDKITSTNAFDIDPDGDDEEQDHGFYVVFPEIARMNHDCRANADYYFDHETLTQYIHAARPISPGEEITISYINPVMRRAARMQRLQRTWGFRCNCHLCTQERARTDASDDRIQQINELTSEFRNYRPESRANPQLAELVISLYEQEQLYGMMYQMYTFAALEYNGVGDPWTATKYARLAIEWGLWSVGETDSDVVEMESLARDPWGHWSWMLRTKKRNGWERRKAVDDDDE